jgi:RNase P/RNase MRP subunit p29
VKAAVTKAKGEMPALAVRIAEIMEITDTALCALPKDAARFEIDIEYADGGRVKIEGRS